MPPYSTPEIYGSGKSADPTRRFAESGVTLKTDPLNKGLFSRTPTRRKKNMQKNPKKKFKDITEDSLLGICASVCHLPTNHNSTQERGKKEGRKMSTMNLQRLSKS